MCGFQNRIKRSIVNRSWRYYFAHIECMARNLDSTTHPLISLDAVQVRSHCISIYRICSSFFINRSLKSFCVTFYSIFMVLSCFVLLLILSWCNGRDTYSLFLFLFHHFFRNVQCSLMATWPKMFMALSKSNTISFASKTEAKCILRKSHRRSITDRSDHRHNAHRTTTRKVLFNEHTTTAPDRCKP